MQWGRKHHQVMNTPSLCGHLTSPTDRSQGSLAHTQVGGLVSWPVHCPRHARYRLPPLQFWIHTHTQYTCMSEVEGCMKITWSGTHTRQGSPVWSQDTYTHMHLNWKPLSAVHITSHAVSAVYHRPYCFSEITSHTISAVNHMPYCFCMVRSPHYVGTTTVEPTHTNMGLNWKPLSAAHVTSHTVSAE